MKLVDANIPLHTVNEDAEQHLRTRRWLDTALSGQETVAFAWVALLAFVRLATRPGLIAAPLSPDAAMDRVEAWLSAGPAVVVSYDRDLDRFPGVRRVEPPVTAPPASDG